MHITALALAGFTAFAAASSSLAAEGAATTRILQQRTADGRTLLTDRPAAGAKTERAWLLDAEDPVAARRRALDVKVEAEMVSARVQRQLEGERLAAADAQRSAARLDLGRAAAVDESASEVVVFAPHRLRAPRRWHGSFFDDRRGPGPRRHGAAPTGRLTGSAGRESR